VTLGERTFGLAVASGATGFGDLSHTWETLPTDARERWEACGRMMDTASRADERAEIVAQLRGIADEESEYLGRGSIKRATAVRSAADRVEAGR
jgi:hypothetical protein